MSILKESFYNIEVCKDDNGRTLLFNSLSESVAWFTPETLDTFHGKSNILCNEVQPDIVNAGFIVQKDKDEVSEYMYARRQISFQEFPKHLSYVIAPTMACNYNCEYCFETKKDNLICTQSTMENILSFLKGELEANKSAEHLHIQWFGGEPLLAFDAIEFISKKLIALCKEKSIKYTATVITNGFFLNREKINKLHAFNVKNLQITLDGMADTYATCKGCTKECFDIVIKNIKECVESIPVTIRLNVSKRNENEIQTLISYILTSITGRVSFHIARVQAYDEKTKAIVLSMKEFEAFQRNLFDWAYSVGYQKNIFIERPKCRPIVCDAMLGKSYVIAPDGCLYKCTHQIGFSEYSVGHIATGGIRNKVALDFTQNELPEKCLHCKILPVCAGGCISNRLFLYSEVDCTAKFSEVIESLKAYVRSKNNL